MKNLFAFIVLLQFFSGILSAQDEPNIFKGKSEAEIKQFLEEKGYKVTSIKAGMPDSLRGAVLYTTYISMGGKFESYNSLETATFGQQGISFPGSLQDLASKGIQYTIYGRRPDAPMVMLIGSASWIYEFMCSEDSDRRPLIFRAYRPSFVSNTLTELGMFGIDKLALVIHKPEIEWIDIPGGTFTMGASKKEMKKYESWGEEQHQVTLDGFKMSKYEITFEQYDIFCSATGRPLPRDEGWGRGKMPVINVSYQDAEAFAEWLGCRLPTEAEWEYACRAGTATPFNTGECLNSDQANFSCYAYQSDCCTNSGSSIQTVPVGSYKPNAWGLYDMHGNVSEWTCDAYGSYPKDPVVNPRRTDDPQGRVVRGGSYVCNIQNVRSAARFPTGIYRPDFASFNPKEPIGYTYVGIRLVSN